MGGRGCEAELGTLAVTQVEDTDCEAPGGAEVELYPEEPAAPIFSRLGRVGKRRVAGGAIGAPGFVLFELDGKGATPSPMGGSDRFASEGDAVGVVARSNDDGIYYDVVYRRYGAAGQLVGGPLTLASDQLSDDDAWIGGAGGQALVVWGFGGELRARGIDAKGKLAGPAFRLGASFYTSRLTVEVTGREAGFALAWSGDPQPELYRSWFARASASSIEGDPVAMATTCGRPHEIVRLAPTPGGYAVLVNAGLAPDWASYVVLLDKQGQPVGGAHRLSGAYRGWDLAAREGELAIMADRHSGEKLLRAFDEHMSPLGPWICLAGPSEITTSGALDADGAGYAMLYWREDLHRELFRRTDQLGSGSP